MGLRAVGLNHRRRRVAVQFRPTWGPGRPKDDHISLETNTSRSTTKPPTAVDEDIAGVAVFPDAASTGRACSGAVGAEGNGGSSMEGLFRRSEGASPLWSSRNCIASCGERGAGGDDAAAPPATTRARRPRTSPSSSHGIARASARNLKAIARSVLPQVRMAGREQARPGDDEAARRASSAASASMREASSASRASPPPHAETTRASRLARQRSDASSAGQALLPGAPKMPRALASKAAMAVSPPESV
mmetsp:Transcript_13257/g.39046  ORF Transcript_13257/g.39046 Transcript_13257/m.39046 type:complete len:248 (+) Transcript_13257:255-998(+)